MLTKSFHFEKCLNAQAKERHKRNLFLTDFQTEKNLLKVGELRVRKMYFFAGEQNLVIRIN